MTTYITVTSQKGGVGKTTNSLSIAHGLALLGHEVLLVDLDPQGQDAIGLGMDPEPGIFSHFVAGQPFENVVRVTGRDGLELLPGDSRTKTVTTVIGSEGIDAAPILALLGSGYDYVIFDTPASGVLQEAAIKISNILIIPGRLEAFGLDGIAATLAATEKLGQPGQVVIVPTALDKRVKEHEANLAQLKEAYGDMVTAPIPQRIFVAECQALGKTIWEHKSWGCEEIQEAYSTLLERLGLVDAGGGL